MRIILSGGGTAGHVYPGLALLKVLASGSQNIELLYVGSSTGLEGPLIQAAGYPFTGLDVSGFPRSVSRLSAAAAVKMAKAVRASRAMLKIFKPNVVVGMGAYVSVPVVLAAASLRIPTVIHEQNSIPGMANRMLGRFANAIAVTYEDTKTFFPKTKQVELTGNPIREDILAADRISARKLLGLDPLDPVILVFGGSRGARQINDAVIGGLEHLLQTGAQVVHSTGEAEYERVKAAVDGEPGEHYRVFPYIGDMANSYAAANLVVSRAGATTLAEITARGLASVLIPYPYATGKHQEKNASILVKAGAAKQIDDPDLTSERLVKEVAPLIADAKQLDEMAGAAKRLGRPEAASKVAELVLRTAKIRKR